MEYLARHSVHATSRESADNDFVRDLKAYHFERCAFPFHFLVKPIGLWNGAGKAVKNKIIESTLDHSLVRYLEDDGVGDKPPSLQIMARFQAYACARIPCGTKHVTR
jgi:hypothetical protein